MAIGVKLTEPGQVRLVRDFLVLAYADLRKANDRAARIAGFQHAETIKHVYWQVGSLIEDLTPAENRIRADVSFVGTKRRRRTWGTGPNVRKM